MINTKYQLGGYLAINLMPPQPAAFKTKEFAMQLPAIAVKHSPEIYRNAGQKPNLHRRRSSDDVVL